MTQNELLWWVGGYTVMSVATAGVYGWDKLAAVRGWRRVPEARLHLGALLGGWPGAWAAQQMFRHKSVKRSFRVVFWLTVVVHVTAVGALAWWRMS